jgi:phenylpyruvate tautomerase PptA (4-oxalocrotonate tautomerase family)
VPRAAPEGVDDLPTTRIMIRSGAGGSMLAMPHAVVEVRRPYSEAEEVAIIDAIHGALIAAFRIPPQDKHVRLVAHQPHRFAVPPTLTEPDLFTLVSIDCFSGRTVQAKRNLYAEIVDRLEVLGIPRDHVSVTLRESDAENWGIRGGRAACDVDLGFNVQV